MLLSLAAAPPPVTLRPVAPPQPAEFRRHHARRLDFHRYIWLTTYAPLGGLGRVKSKAGAKRHFRARIGFPGVRPALDNDLRPDGVRGVNAKGRA
jgi:hypothetical protein